MTSMPVPTRPDASTTAEVILGVDTHKDLHVAAIVGELGQLLATQTFPATSAGYKELSTWAHTYGRLRRAGIECTGSYGAALMRHLRAQGVEVIEVNQPDKANRRKRGKTDALDAEAAAQAVVSGRAQAQAKTGDGPVEALRLLRMARNSAAVTVRPTSRSTGSLSPACATTNAPRTTSNVAWKRGKPAAKPSAASSAT